MRIINFNSALALEHSKELRSEDTIVGVTIGNFDGAHLGHQALFKRLREETAKLAAQQGKKAICVLMTFAPHPRVALSDLTAKELNSNSRFWSLTSVRAKAQLASGNGFEYFFPLRFKPSFANLSPEAFVRSYLSEFLHAQVVVVGFNWSFGKNRSGDANNLKKLGHKYGFETHIVEPVLIDGLRVSSSTVKQHLAESDLAELETLIGRKFSICGLVEKGQQRGAKMSFPTANIIAKRQLLPKSGVYATKVRVEQGPELPAVTNIGVRPTFGGNRKTVETHILDGRNHELYGRRLEIIFLKHLRDEMKFENAEALTSQIRKDCEIAKTVV